VAIGATVDQHDPTATPFLRFAPEAAEAFSEFLASLMRELRTGDLHPALESHFSKYRKLVPSLALVLHLLDGGSGPVSLTATTRALAWAECLRPHAERLYGSGIVAEARAAKAILKRLRAGDIPAAFDARTIYRACWAGLDREATRAGLDVLADLGWIVARVSTDTGGRPSRTYLANPKVLA
jgi:putative DNA primase/helicase